MTKDWGLQGCFQIFEESSNPGKGERGVVRSRGGEDGGGAETSSSGTDKLSTRHPVSPDYGTTAQGKRQDSLPRLSANSNVPAQPWDQHS